MTERKQPRRLTNGEENGPRDEGADSRVEAEDIEMNRALRLDREHFRALVENSLDIITILDREFRYVYYSPSTQKMLGYDGTELLGKSPTDYIHPDDVDGVSEVFAKLLEEPGREITAEYRFRRKDGTWRDLESRAKVVDGGPPGAFFIVANSRDVTEKKAMQGDLEKHRERLEELVAERTRELEKSNERLKQEIAFRAGMEEELRRSEAGYRLLAENVADIIWTADLNLRLTYISPSVERVTGYSVEEAMANTIDGSLTPESRRAVKERIVEAMEEFRAGELDLDKVWTLEAEQYRKDGSSMWTDLTVRLLRDDAGLPTGLLGVSRDITERKMMEEELKRREEKYRFLIENAQDVIMVLDERGNTTYVSPSGERVLGYTPEEIMDMRGFPIIHPEDLPKTVEGLRRIAAGAVMRVNLDMRMQRKGGAWRDMEVTATSFLDRPTVRGIIVNFRDITERKQARNRLERINHLFLSLGTDLFENMEKIVETCRDVLGGTFAAYYRMEKGRLSILSTAEGMEGFIVARSPRDYIPFRVISLDDEMPLIAGDLGDRERYGTDSLAERFGFRSLLGYPVKSGGSNMGCICYYEAAPRAFSHEDMEIMGMLARALTVEEERLAREQSLKDFLDVASHELRHPITLMKGYAVTINRFIDKLDDKAKREYLGVIERGADRLDTLIRELLDGSRIERGRFTLSKRQVRLVPLLERAVKEMADKGCAHRLLVDAPAAMPPREVDAEKLVRVLVILLDNAVAHSPASFPVEVVMEERNGEAMITVMDRGVGVPQEDWERIFERFYQVEDALHHTTRGMGLGLFIARDIVEKHGGCIWYEPRLGGGSVFRFTLP